MGTLEGANIHHYQINSLLRYESLFDVYGATDLRSLEEVVFQIFLPGRSYSYRFVDDMREQAELLMRLEHPNLVVVLDAGECEAGFYLVTRPVTGQRLCEMDLGRMPVRQAAGIAAQVASALAYLHQQKMVHGMLSPEHILLGEDGKVSLLNFGLSHILQREVFQSVPESMVGIGIASPDYLAPEQVLGRNSLPQSDQYALGTIFYGLLFGRKPYEIDNPIEAAMQKTVKPLTWPKPFPKAIPSGAVQVILKSLARQPGDRFKNTEEMHKIFDRLAKGKWVSIRLSGKLSKLAPTRSHLGLWLSGGAFILLLLGGGFYFFFLTPGFGGGQPTQVAVAQSTPLALPTLSPVLETKPAPVTITPSPTTEILVEPSATPTILAVETLAAVASNKPLLIGSLVDGQMEVLSPDANISQIREVYRLGLGKWMQITWADADTFAAASSAGVFVLQKGVLVRFIDTQGWASSVQFSLDRKILAVGMLNGDIQLWDWNQESQIFLLQGHKGRVTRMLFSPNRRHMFSTSEDLNIKIWDINSGLELSNIPAHQLPVEDFALTQDGRYLISGAGDHLVKVWDIASTRKLFEINHGAEVSAVAISPDGTWIAAGGGGWIKQWNFTSRQLRADPIPFRWGLLSLYYNDEAKRLIAQSVDGKVRSIQADLERYVSSNYQLIASGQEIEAISVREGTVWRGAEEVNSSQVSIGRNEFLQLTWDEKTMNRLYEDFTDLFFSPDSAYLIAYGEQGLTYLWEAQSNWVSNLKAAEPPPGDPFSQDSQKYTLLGDKRIAPSKRGAQPVNVRTIKIMNAATSAEELELLDVPLGASVRFIHNDTILLVSNGSQIRIWDINSGLEAHLKSANEYGCMVIRSQTNNEVLAVHTVFGLVTEWDEKIKYLCSLGTRFSGPTSTISPKLDRVAYFNANRLLEVLDLETQQTLWKLLPDRTVTSMSFSPDGLLLVTGSSDGRLTLWDARNGQILLTLPGHFSAVRKAIFSPDGKMIASGSLDGTVRIWAVVTGEK